MASAEGMADQPKELVAIFEASVGDEKPVTKIVSVLSYLRTPAEVATASAHRTPVHTWDLLQYYNKRTDPTVIIAAVGRIHALNGMIDANTRFPVIALCILSEDFKAEEIVVAHRNPPRIASLITTDPEVAAIAAAKIIGLSNPDIARRVVEYQMEPAQAVLDGHPKMQEKFRKLWDENPIQKERDEKAREAALVNVAQADK